MGDVVMFYTPSYTLSFDDFISDYNGAMLKMRNIHGELVYYVGYDVIEGGYVSKVDIVHALKPEIIKNFKHYYIKLITIHTKRKKVSKDYLFYFVASLTRVLNILNVKHDSKCVLQAEIELFTGDYIIKKVDVDFVYNMLYYKTDEEILIESVKKESEEDDKFKKFTDYNKGSSERCSEYVEDVERYWRKQLDDP